MVRAGRDLVSHDATVREAGGVDVPWVDAKLGLKPLEKAEHEAGVCTTPEHGLSQGILARGITRQCTVAWARIGRSECRASGAAKK